jgi:hypothetical protein
VQRGFEIQHLTTQPLVAVNICLENTGGGALHYWNLEPDAAARTAFGLTETGYPYPTEALQGIRRIELPVKRGDIYFFNGKLLHAVEAQDDPVGHRATISFLMAFKDPKTVIYWA